MIWRLLARAFGPGPTPTLICMRLADMLLVHPEMTSTLACYECGELLGIYPSGQAALRKYGDRLKLVCHICGEDRARGAMAAPGVAAELGRSVPRFMPWPGRRRDQ